MRLLLRLTGWATVLFMLAWTIAHPYQRIITAAAGWIAAPAGSEIEPIDLELFYPFDMSVFVALCLASNWVSWRARLRSAAVGLAPMLAIQVLTLVVVMKVMLASAGQAATQAEATQRLVIAIIRVTGLVAAGCTWAYMLGWQQLPRLLGSIPVRGRGLSGGKR